MYAVKTDVTAVQDAQVATDDMITILNTMVSDFSLMIAAQVNFCQKVTVYT
jgi:hypothetical protein